MASLFLATFVGAHQQNRNAIRLHRKFLATINSSAVISHDDEDRVLLPSVIFGFVEEHADRPVRVFDRVLSAQVRRRPINSTVGIRKRPMVRDRQQHCKKWFSFGMQPVELCQRAIEKVFVRNAPSVDEFRIHEIFLFNKTIKPVGRHEGTNSVKHTTTGIHEGAVVVALLQCMSQRENVLRMITFEDRLRRNRWH